MPENKDKKPKPPRIHDVDINRAAVTKAPSIDEFKKVNPEIFSHLSAEDQDDAYKALFAEFPPAAAAAVVPATPAKTTSPAGDAKP